MRYIPWLVVVMVVVAIAVFSVEGWPQDMEKQQRQLSSLYTVKTKYEGVLEFSRQKVQAHKQLFEFYQAQYKEAEEALKEINAKIAELEQPGPEAEPAPE